MSDWKQTKKEYYITEDGVRKKVTEEPGEKKATGRDDLIDRWIKIIGVVSIFTPLWLLYTQHHQEIDKDRIQSLTKTYLSIAGDVRVLENNGSDSKEFKSAADSLIYQFQTKIALFKDFDLNHEYSKLVRYCTVLKDTKVMRIMTFRSDSLLLHLIAGVTILDEPTITLYDQYDPQNRKAYDKLFNMHNKDLKERNIRAWIDQYDWVGGNLIPQTTHEIGLLDNELPNKGFSDARQIDTTLNQSFDLASNIYFQLSHENIKIDSTKVPTLYDIKKAGGLHIFQLDIFLAMQNLSRITDSLKQIVTMQQYKLQAIVLKRIREN